MPWNFDSDKPIFIQLVERLESDIVSGKYAPGDKLPTVRELAVEAAVNPNTMQKALAEIERNGYIISLRTSGKFVTDNQELILSLNRDRSEEIVRNFLSEIKRLGLTVEDAVELVKKYSTDSTGGKEM